MTDDTIELRDPTTQQAQRFQRVSWGAIVVSFSHMAGAMALYSGQAWLDKGIAAAMILIVDLSIWATTGYLLYCQLRGRKAHPIVVVMLGLAVVTSISLNWIAIWSHRPADMIVHPALSALVATVFSLLISGFIVAASVVEGELARDRHAAHDARVELATLREQAEQARAETERLARIVREGTNAAEQEANTWRAAAEHARTLAEQQAGEVEQHRMLAEQAGRYAEQQRARAEQAERAAEQLRALPPPDPNAMLVAIGGRSYSVRQVAEAFGVAPSTATGKLQSVREKGAKE